MQRSTVRKIIVKTFPGAAVKDMNHYLKPTLESHPEMIMLHVGTNDIPKKNPSDIVNEIESLGKIIVENGSTKVAISEIIQREDQVLNTNVKETNIPYYINFVVNTRGQLSITQTLIPRILINQVCI